MQRLDVGTSGLVTFARRPDLVAKWDRALQAATTRKIYVAAARGVTPSKGAITRDLREDGKIFPARTRYRRLAVAAATACCASFPSTAGRTRSGGTSRRSGTRSSATTATGTRRRTASSRRRTGSIARSSTACGSSSITRTPARGSSSRRRSPATCARCSSARAGPGTLRFLDHKNALGTSGTSHLPPGPDEVQHDRGSALDVDASSPTLRPELTGDDDDGRESGGY